MGCSGTDPGLRMRFHAEPGWLYRVPPKLMRNRPWPEGGSSDPRGTPLVPPLSPRLFFDRVSRTEAGPAVTKYSEAANEESGFLISFSMEWVAGHLVTQIRACRMLVK